MDKDEIINTAAVVEGGLVGRERETKEKLVISAIKEQSSQTVTADEVVRHVRARKNIELDSTIVENVMGKLESEDVLRHNSDGQYRVVKQKETTSFDDLFEPVWEDFKQTIDSSDYDRQIDYKLDNYRDALREFFFVYYRSLIQETEDPTGLSEYISNSLSDRSFSDAIDETINNKPIQDGEVFRELLEEYIQYESDTLTEFFGTIYIGVVNQDLLSRAHDLDLSTADDEKKILFLDTNAIIPLVCNTDPLNPLVVSLCERSQELDYDIYYLPITAKEMDRVVGKTQQNLSGFQKNSQSDSFDNQFIGDFTRRKDIVSSDSYSTRIGKWRSILDTEYNVSEYTDDLEMSTDYDVVETWVKELDKLESDEYKSKEQIEHDTRLIMSILTLRNMRPDGPVIGPFGISNNKALLPINKLGTEKWKDGVLIDPQGWLNYLVTFTPAKFVDESERDVAKAIISTAADFDDGYSLDEYLDLIIAKSNISEKSEFLKEIILEAPLANQLENAARRGDGEMVEEAGYKILDGIEEYIKQERETTQKLKITAEKYNEEQKEKEKERERRKQLEEVIENAKGIELNVDVNQEMQIQITQEVQNDLNKFISDLEETLDGGIEGSKIPAPPKNRSDPDQVRNWLKTVDETLTRAESITDSAKRLAPYAKGLLSMLAI